MSVLRVASIVGQGHSTTPSFTKGLSMGEASTITGNMNIVGTATCTALVGDGSLITGLGGDLVTGARAIALMGIF
jgi:hypothetical protein